MHVFPHITNHCFLSSQIPWARVKFIFGCTSTGPTDCNDTKPNWVAFTRRKMRLEQNRVDCVQTELKTKLRKKQNRTNKYIPSLFLIAPAIFFFPVRVATRKIYLGVGGLVWTPWFESDEGA